MNSTLELKQLNYIYKKGPDFFEACCARKAWESIHG